MENFDIFNYHVVYFMAFWYILFQLVLLSPFWLIVSRTIWQPWPIHSIRTTQNNDMCHFSKELGSRLFLRVAPSGLCSGSPVSDELRLLPMLYSWLPQGKKTFIIGKSGFAQTWGHY
jgi:hypothetical protein